jgi:hypothetical protein
MKNSNKAGFFAVCAFLAMVAVVAVGAQGQAPAGDAGRGRGRGPEPPAPPQAGHPSGKLVLGGDLSLFITPASPDNCILTNRFKKGQRVGFRMTATDGGTGEPENSAVLTAHVTVGGRTIDVPMRFRGAAGPTAPAPRGYLRAPYNLWVGIWVVPDDTPTGALSYTVTATDKFGRTAEFTPYPYENSQLAIVQ